MLRENRASAAPGVLMLVTLIVAIVVVAVAWFVPAARAGSGWEIFGSAFLIVALAFCFAGLSVVNPNQGLVVQLFGGYVGTLRHPGLWWGKPFTARKRVSLRVRNFESGKLKVNGHGGNPV